LRKYREFRWQVQNIGVGSSYSGTNSEKDTCPFTVWVKASEQHSQHLERSPLPRSSKWLRGTWTSHRAGHPVHHFDNDIDSMACHEVCGMSHLLMQTQPIFTLIGVMSELTPLIAQTANPQGRSNEFRVQERST
jgi:hypothetical protein